MATQKIESLKTIWQRIDHITCISLVNRQDRQTTAKQQFAGVGLDDRVAFYLARRHPDNCEQGIFESHLACLKIGLDAGARHMLVFEDDVVFGNIDAQRLSTGIDFFIRQEGCPIFFLGCLINKSTPTDYPAVRRVQYHCLAHAYLINAALARRIVETPWQNLPFDAVLRGCTDRHFALYPSIAFQSNSPTDNTRHRTLDAIRRLFGGLRVIQMANEHYHRFRVAVIVAHLLVVAALTLWMLTR